MTMTNREANLLARAVASDLEPALPIGGRKVHAKLIDGWAAVCGYAPSSPGTTLIRPRDGWYRSRDGVEITCKRCRAKLQAMNIPFDLSRGERR